MANGMEEVKYYSQMQLSKKESGYKTKNNDSCVHFTILIFKKLLFNYKNYASLMFKKHK